MNDAPPLADVLADLNRAKVAFQMRALCNVLGIPTQGMEARQGGDEGSVHDSPVAASDAPTPQSKGT